ncbi:MAG TPA: S8 family serine peptidase [Gaiellaceae bacterium]|nr:S8 family serine peptidase [Gaiellaceae bacterium]
MPLHAICREHRSLTRVTLLFLLAAAAAVALSGDVQGAGPDPLTEVVVTLHAPPLSVFGRKLLSASHSDYLARIDAEQGIVAMRVESALPAARVRWHYRLVANGLAVVVPRSQVGELARIPGVAKVWPNVRYHALRDTGGPEQIGADKLWGPQFETAGNGMKIGIIDDGLEASHPYFNPSGFQYPPGFPKGMTKYTTPKVIVQRTFTPASPTWKYAKLPFDPANSFHATHVAGIAAGVHGTNAAGNAISGVAPNAYLGNYKALTIPTPGFGLDGNSAEIAAAIEAAVSDGMNVINLSLGEPEVDPSRDIVVQAIEGAAAAGVVPVIAAGNDFTDFGYGSVSSPGNAPDAITVAAVTARDAIADFSSAGPTPVSLQMKPDVSAPGVSVLSSLPESQGTWGLLSGTSMATPHVAGAAALLKERHPTWTVAQIKSALEQTGDPVKTASGSEVPSSREGGGLIDLPRADAPLLFASPTGLSFGRLAPGVTATHNVTLTDAGGGAGTWAVTSLVQQGTGVVTVPATVDVPGTLIVTATGGTAPGEVTGFVVLTHGTDSRRVPFWFATSMPKLAGEAKLPLKQPGTYRGTTVGAPSLIGTYRYPTGGDVTYAGPETAYRVTITGHPANFGVVVTAGRVTPHVTFDGAEDHLVGYTGLPLDLNPYRKAYGESVAVAGAVLPASGTYDVVFDTRSAADSGPFKFHYWVNDVTPPTLRVHSSRGGIVVTATDAGSGVDPSSIVATLDGKAVKARYARGTIRVAATKGTHRLVLSVADYQETKNMEDVPPILPNTRTLRATVRVR